MIKLTSSGSTKQMEKFLANAAKPNTIESRVRPFCEAGVRALAAATPTDSGLTAASWSYEIVPKKGSIDIYWKNSNQNDGQIIAVLLQFGHGTRTGGYVAGRDYINPSLHSIFDQIADSAWKAVTSA